jgi:hypothetical protein
MSEQYPLDLPAPLVSGYQVDVRYGVTAVAFERGNSRQRKSVTTQRHVFNLSFVFSAIQLWQWQSWANRYGYDWHYMDLISSYSGASGAIPHLIRYTGDISFQTIDLEHVRVSIDAEMDLNTLPLGDIVPSGDWIIGGTPAAPSSSNSIQAGTPAAPSSDFIVAGSPGTPAA